MENNRNNHIINYDGFYSSQASLIIFLMNIRDTIHLFKHCANSTASKANKNCDNIVISIKYNFSCLNSINSLVVVAKLVKLSCRSGFCRHPQQPESPTTLKSGNKYRAESNYRKVLPTANLSLVFAISCKNCRQSRPVW